MLIELNDLPRCGCGAVFIADEDLGCHTRENENCISILKELIRFAFSQIERFQIHSRTKDADDIADDEPCSKHRDTEGRFHCPLWGCDFKATKPNHLLTHYGRHTPLHNEPPCVRCGKRINTIGQFLEHAKQHVGDNSHSEAKNEYSRKRCEELRKERDSQLAHVDSKIGSPLASKKRKRNRTAKVAVGASATRFDDHDSPSSQPESDLPPCQDVTPLNDAIVPHHASQLPSHMFTLPTEPGLQGNPKPGSGNGAAIVQLGHHGSTYEFHQPPTNMNSRLQTADPVESHNHAIGPYHNSHMSPQHRHQLSPLESGPPITQEVRSEGNTSISQPSSHVNAQHTNTLLQLDNGSLTSQGARFDNNTTTNMMIQSVHPLPVRQEAAQYAIMDMDNLIRPGMLYTNFSPVVGTLNFATQ